MKDQIPCIKQEGESSQKTTPTSIHHFFPDSSANLKEICKLFYSRNTVVPLITFSCITNKMIATASFKVCFPMYVYTARYMCIKKHTHTNIVQTACISSNFSEVKKSHQGNAFSKQRQKNHQNPTYHGIYNYFSSLSTKINIQKCKNVGQETH